MLLQGLCVKNYNQICEVLKIKTMTEGYDDHSPQTIPLKTMYLRVLQTLQFCCYQHKVQIAIREHFYQDFRAKLVRARSYFCFFSFFFLLFPNNVPLRKI